VDFVLRVINNFHGAAGVSVSDFNAAATGKSMERIFAA